MSEVREVKYRRRRFLPRLEPRLIVDGRAWIHLLNGEEIRVSPILADLSDAAKVALAFFGFSGRCGFRFCRDKQPLTALNQYGDICRTCSREVKPLLDELCGINRELHEVIQRAE